MGLSRDRLAYLAEMTREEIDLLEWGEAEPTLAKGIRLSAVLEVPMGRLSDGIEPPWTKLPAAGAEAATQDGRGAA